MKKFTFFDENGNSHAFRPSQFASTASIEHFLLKYPLSDSVRRDFAVYGEKAHAYMVARQVGRESQRKLFNNLARRIRAAATFYFFRTPLNEVLDEFAKFKGVSTHRFHSAFCRGYVPADERADPPFELYFGTFGGGFAFYTYFSTRYRVRHLVLLSDWWFLNGAVDQSKVDEFCTWCDYATWVEDDTVAFEK